MKECECPQLAQKVAVNYEHVLPSNFIAVSSVTKISKENSKRISHLKTIFMSKLPYSATNAKISWKPLKILVGRPLFPESMLNLLSNAIKKKEIRQILKSNHYGRDIRKNSATHPYVQKHFWKFSNIYFSFIYMSWKLQI